MCTLKGKGLAAAEQNKEKFHWILPGTLDEKEDLQPAAVEESYLTVTNDYILNKVKQDPAVIAISAATPGAYGFTPEFRKQLGKNYTDVGIAEEHAVAYSSALAKAGAKPNSSSAADNMAIKFFVLMAVISYSYEVLLFWLRQLSCTVYRLFRTVPHSLRRLAL